jgi:hypothetical protein
MRLSTAAAIRERPALWTQTDKTVGLSAIGKVRSVRRWPEQPDARRKGNADHPNQHGRFDESHDAAT